jgi:hypothetical protein
LNKILTLIHDFLATADTIGSTESLSAGIDKLYLVPLGDNFSLFFKREEMTSLPSLDEIPLDMEMEMYAAQFVSNRKDGTAGFYFENTITFSMPSNVANWMAQNQEKRFWVIALMGERWIITGDEQMPYRIENDYGLGKSAGQKQGWDVMLKSDQIRPYHVYKILTGGGGGE